MLRLILTFVILCFASPALAGFPIPPGFELTMTIDAKGEPFVIGIGRATLTPQDRAALATLATIDCKTPQCAPLAMKDDGALPKPAPLKPNTVVIAFVVENGQSGLIIRNGYDMGFVYRARITRDGREGPTDVCLVMPKKRGYEHWPYPISQIELSDLSLRPWKPKDGLPCA
jgi:hypothetical protein